MMDLFTLLGQGTLIAMAITVVMTIIYLLFFDAWEENE